MSAEAEKLFSGTGPIILTSRADSQRTRLASCAGGSGEGRGGEEGRSRWWPDHLKKKKEKASVSGTVQKGWGRTRTPPRAAPWTSCRRLSSSTTTQAIQPVDWERSQRIRS